MLCGGEDNLGQGGDEVRIRPREWAALGCQHRSSELERRQKAADPRIKDRETLSRD